VTPANAVPSSGVSIPAAEAVSLVESGDVWLLDVREDFEWNEVHAPSAHHIPVGDLGRRQHELPDNGMIAVICHVGGRSRMVTDALVAADYRAVDVSGGMVAWQASGGEVLVGGEAEDRS
jgi:rhodanese-related sulfurtransferase